MKSYIFIVAVTILIQTAKCSDMKNVTLEKPDMVEETATNISSVNTTATNSNEESLNNEAQSNTTNAPPTDIEDVTRFTSAYSCCVGASVDETSYDCMKSKPCTRKDEKCGKLEVYFGNTRVVARSCISSKQCENADDAYEGAKKSISRLPGINGSQPTSKDIICCESDKCNATGLLKGVRFNVYCIIALVLAYFCF